MKNRLGLPILVTLLALTLTAFSGCGSSNGSSTSSSASSGLSSSLSPVSLSMTDAPPPGVTIFSFEVTLNSAVLNPGSIDLLAGKGPLDIEVKRLETETALINTANVPAGTYTSVQLTFANPRLTFRNDTGATLAGCAPTNVCEAVKPTGSLTTIINLPAGGGALSSGTPAGFIVDVNLASLFNADMTLDFGNAQAATLQRVPLSSVPTGQVEKLEEVEGIVANKNTTTNHFTLQTPSRGNLDVAVNSTTRFDDCSANTLAACIQNDQAVEVDLGLMAGGVLYARKLDVEDNATDALDDSIEGFIYSIPDATHFQIVTVDFLRGSLGIGRGRRLIVHVPNGTKFDVVTGGLTLPPDILTAKTAFAAATDTSRLQVGQHVQVRSTLLTPALPPSLPTLEANRVRLTQTRFTATVASVTGTTTFTVNGLPPVFANLSPPVTSIQVETSTDTEFENATGVTDLSPTTQVSLRGFLFQGAPPTMFADKVRKR
jgi:Domain of unknown function (DUF5666)